MNQVTLTGRLASEPQIKYSQSAEPLAITKFTLAVKSPYKKEKEKNADFIDCVAFGKLAEFIGKYFTKGKMIGIVGVITSNIWEDENGNKRKSTEVRVEKAEFLEKKPTEDKTEESFVDDVEKVEENEELPFE